MKILAIDTSCDDTSVAIADDLKILSNVSWTKLKVHEEAGGVVPDAARRQHKQFLNPCIQKALKNSDLTIKDIDLIAVTQGPGLAIALEAGIEKARELSTRYNIPLVPINHMIGHIYSVLTRNENSISYSDLNEFKFPLLAMTISGGHTELIIMKGHLEFQVLGKTLDDAVGEAFDKVARMLGMGYPGGPKVEQAASKGDPNKYEFPRPMINSNNYNFSFSGLKTAVLYRIQNPQNYKVKIEDYSSALSETEINDIAASFQKAVIDVLIHKMAKAVEEFNPKMFIVGGGVIANTTLRNAFTKKCNELNVPFYYPKALWLCADNASMIATAAYYYHKTDNLGKSIEIDRKPRLEIPNLYI